MFGKKSQKSPEDVFTPRSPQVNPAMYVARPDLESDLKSALRSTQHVLVHGESGTGKSWLYKKVLAEIEATTMVANLANAARLGSLNAEFKNILDRRGAATITGYREKKHASADVVVAKGGMEHEKTFALGQKEPFEACCEMVRDVAGREHVACIVLDNLEAVFKDTTLMDELAQVIILLDDERYAQHKVKIVIVGVPTGVRDYFNKTPTRGTVANRLYEISEVSRLTADQAGELVRRGFAKELEYAVREDVMSGIVEHVLWVTGRVPQRIHEYCLELARVGELERCLRLDMLPVADKRWLRSSLSEAYSAIETLMNERDTKIGRRNQTLFVLGRMKKGEFRSSEVEELIRTHFPKSTSGKTLDCSTLLARLAQGESPILRRTPKGDSFQFADPKYRMCIRAMLKKDGEKEVVTKISHGGASSGEEEESSEEPDEQ